MEEEQSEKIEDKVAYISCRHWVKAVVRCAKQKSREDFGHEINEGYKTM